MTRSLLDELESLGGETRTVVPIHRPLIPFLKEPWSSKSKYPAIMLETFLYGVYVVLFACCFYTLVKQKTIQKTILIASSLLFVLATADILVTGYFFFHFVLKQPRVSTSATASMHETWNRILEIKFGFYVVANAIASSLLINRCYEVWQNKRIVVAPIAMVACGTVISFVSLTATQLGDKLLAASFITSAAANLSITLLMVNPVNSATRIWWTSRKMKGLFKMDLSIICDYVISLILDSGAFYSLSIFLYLVFHTGVTITGVVLRKSSCEALGEVSLSTTTLPETPVGYGFVERTRSIPRHNLSIRTNLLANRPQRSDSIGTETQEQK
ncbi:hypothetical protein CVT25_005146 [Psilocybe cyanescens]|uniref:Uncharacterized protein n=1 Tax=Psilocybe cyanescens TaxID=93625 RepID=A0A409XBR5_PSICY|nr:hypothetical protein CVT25_005146 [Psilocybe cyanescens]